MLEFRLLGPVEVDAGGRRLEIRPRQRLVVLAALAVDAGLVVPADVLIRRVWDKPPKQDRHALHVHISHLRRLLRDAGAAEPDRPGVQLARRSNGYILEADREAIDLYRFRALVARARAAVEERSAAALFAQAAQLWRGDALTGLNVPWSDSVRTSLHRERLAVELDRTDVRLRLGEHAQLVDTLAGAVATDPQDERLAGQYMLALYRCGRQADALAHYERLRRRLDNRVGVLSAPLRELRQKILHGDAPLLAVPVPAQVAVGQEPPPKAERMLPADVAGFVGRADELRRLLAGADAAAAGSVRAPAIHAVDGMAGVGKTAFAVHAAHHLAARYPDGQRYVELRAHAPGQHAVDPADALAVLLQSDGVAAHQIPTGLDARIGLWRERMADKKILLVLDDAADTTHVEPLLPASPGCLVLITSRRKLATLPGATLLSLDTLPAPDAAHLFVHRAGPRACHDPAAVQRICHLCGYLPLAITLTAARFHLHPTWKVADLADDLDRARDRLGHIATGHLAVAAAFELSYRDLPPERQRLFRRLALHPGADFDSYAAAALDDTTEAAARRGLEGLLEHNLLTEPHRGRYRFHDLIAAHARTQAALDPEAGRTAVLDRLLAYYEHTATVAAGTSYTGAVSSNPAAIEAPAIGDPRDASVWFVTEQSNLAAVTADAATRDNPAAIGIPAALHDHLRNRGSFDLAIRLHRTALITAQRTGNQPAEAHTLVNLAHMLCLTAEYSDATAAAEQAHTLYLQLRDTRGQACALDAIARLRHMTDDYPAAITVADQAHTLFRNIGDRLGQARALDTLARARGATGDFPAATVATEQARVLYQQVGDRRGQADAMDLLARVQYATGDYPAAVATAAEAGTLYQQIGNRLGLANTLNILARVQHMTEDHPAAVATAEQSRVLHRQLGNRLGHAMALDTLARVRRATGDHPAAAAVAEEARSLYQQIGDRHGEASAVQSLGIVYHATGDHLAAAASLEQALDLFRKVGDPAGEAETLNHIGQLHLDSTTPAAAHRQFAAALDIARRIGTPAHEARALEGIAECVRRQGHDNAPR